jgi:hypothetical protein
MPPSAVVTIFTAWKLNTLASAQALPTGHAPVAGAGGMRRVLEQPEAVAVGQRAQFAPVAGQPGEVDRDHHLRQRARARASLSSFSARAAMRQVPGVASMSTKSTSAPQYSGAVGRREEAVRAGPHPRARPHAQRQAGQVQPGGGVADRHRRAPPGGGRRMRPRRPAPRGPGSGSPSAAPRSPRRCRCRRCPGGCRDEVHVVADGLSGARSGVDVFARSGRAAAARSGSRCCCRCRS